MQKSRVGLELVTTKTTPGQNDDLVGYSAAAQLKIFSVL